MEKRLIDANSLCKAISNVGFPALNRSGYIDRECVYELIKKAPTFEDRDLFNMGYFEGKKIVERPKGEWIDLGYALEEYRAWGKCSVCGYGMFQSDFCPNCGADMRGGQDNG